MTIVSLAIKFNAACHELCKQLHPGVDLDTNAKVKQEMLHLAIKEFDDCCANLNKVYMLSSLQRDAVTPRYQDEVNMPNTIFIP